MTPIDALAWVHVRDRRLLSVRTRGKAKFYLPGGKREPGEGDVAGLCREIREELGVELDPLTFRFFALLDEQADGFADGRRVRMTCYTAEHGRAGAVGRDCRGGVAGLRRRRSVSARWAARPADAGRAGGRGLTLRDRLLRRCYRHRPW